MVSQNQDTILSHNMHLIIISALTLCLVLVTCFTPSNYAPISRDATPVITNVESSSRPLFIIEHSEQLSVQTETPKSDFQPEVASAPKIKEATKSKSSKTESSTDEGEGEASAPEPKPRGMSSVLKKGLGLYYLVMFVVGLVAWCGRPVRKVPEERYALYYGRQDGVGEAGEGYHHG